MRVRWLGRVPYREAWDLQRAVSRRSAEDYLLLLEHPSVYTLGANGDAGHVLVDPASVGADMVRVDRGGDVTYHGPGQLVGYPLLTVGPGPHRGPAPRAPGRAGGHRRPGRPGHPPVHGGTAGRLPGRLGRSRRATRGRARPGPRKICAIGVRTSRGRTTHGFALNVRPRPVDVRPHRALRDRRQAGDLAGGRRAAAAPMAEVVDAVDRLGRGRSGVRPRTSSG